MGHNIDLREVQFHKLTVDNCGKIFTWQDRLFRAINPAAVDRVLEMFQIGLLAELIEKRLFVRSWITDYILDGYGLVVEHEQITPLVYPYEWSFSMLKDSALAILKINEIARRYGYQTTDCHGFNICFDGTDPLFVDLGSLNKIVVNYGYWPAYEEFLRYYYYPLRIWSHGNYYFARRALYGCSLNDMMTHRNYYLYNSRLLRKLGNSFLGTVERCRAVRRQLSIKPRTLLKNIREKGLKAIRLKDLAGAREIDLTSLIRKVQKISAMKYRTRWGDYHLDYYDAQGNTKKNERFERIINIIKSYKIKTVLELAGNQGLFSRQLVQQSEIDKIVCTDSDENAVELLYVNAKKRKMKIVPAILDFVFPMSNYFYNRPPFERFKADAVVALAVTHHLILSQRLSVDYILSNISMYTKRYVFVEFMPLGLYDGKNVPQVPLWYTTDWFRESFGKIFRILHEEILEENRVLFVGERIC